MIELCLSVQVDTYELEVCSNEHLLSASVAEIVPVGGGPYTGDYVVDPSFVESTLPTKDKLLLEDVTINPIEVVRVSNPSGGKTVFIGGNFNG